MRRPKTGGNGTPSVKKLYVVNITDCNECYYFGDDEADSGCLYTGKRLEYDGKRFIKSEGCVLKESSILISLSGEK